MPWARVVDRLNDGLGSHNGPNQAVAYPPGKGVPGAAEVVCRGCGLPYAPEPGPKPAETLRSNAGQALVV